MRSPSRRTVAVLGSLLLSAGLLAAPVQAASAASAPSSGWGKAAKVPKADLDVLYVGAHPDDEAGRLSMFGEWRERFGAKTGVVTITRGEGGGNAVGPEEGPDLGLIREREERGAVAEAGVTDVYNLDKVDFYYSVSAPLHQQAWDEKETLARLVRVIRSTRPELVATMNPAPSPGNHGGHQLAARLAAQAYQVAGDPKVFPEQITKEGLEPFAPSKLLSNSAAGTPGANGASCTTTFKAADPTDDVYGVWSGRRARSGQTWAQIEREAQREYASQGWSGFPDVSADPAGLGCDYMLQVESRVPFTRGDMSPDAAPSDTMLQGAVRQAPGGLPLGTGLAVTTSDFEVVPGGSTTVKVQLTAPRRTTLRDVRAAVTLPQGWQGPSTVRMGTVRAGRTVTRTLTVTAADDATTGKRALVGVDVTSGRRSGHNSQQLEVVGAADGKQQALPQVSEYDTWAADNGLPQLAGRVTRVLTLPQGGSSGGGCSCPSCCGRTVGVDVRNNGGSAESGTVTLDLPDGFTADATSRRYEGLAPGETRRVDFEVSVEDPDLPTSNQGGAAGDYAYTITTTSSTGSSTSTPALELVPTAQADQTAAPTLDGTVGEGEYAAKIDLSRRWEGDACTSAADCSATGWITRSGDALYVAAEVTDDTLGTVLSAEDCKRHWRVDSVEIAIDPTGRSENTSTTFKAAVLPTTTEGVACASRDADNRQGPIGQFPQVDGTGTPAEGDGGTAPGFEAVSKVSEPYTGYVIEAKIPFSALPGTVDPEQMAMNMFVYDSDTQDKTGQTRIGWSTWGGVQGDPYRWGRVAVGGDAPPQVETREPELNFPALDSLDSPQSIEQAVRTGVALAGLPAARENRSARLRSARLRGDDVAASVRVLGPGRAHLSAVDADGKVVGQRTVELFRGRSTVRFEAPGAVRVLLGYAAEAGGSTSSAVRVR
ncbi:sugar-binding protein [Solicola sp. PLA-1-18]|uniref:sugar-binding protein n=1 Tax=Solicola sp. PLA-1-18 TaxID=3380532 RepID=UPI003B80B043